MIRMIKIAYLHSMSFPSNEANAFDAVWTASALSKVVDTTLFIPRNRRSYKKLKEFYYIQDSPLRIRSLHLDLIPDRILLRIKNYYDKLLLRLFRFLPAWSLFQGKKVLYMRDPRQLRFWGLQRERSPWLKKWTFVYEAHDPLGFDPEQLQGRNPFEDLANKERAEITLRAARNFDLLICNTQALADDLRDWTHGVLDPNVITLASPLPRLIEPPTVTFGNKIIVGYIGTIDTFRGVDLLLESFRYLPENFTLRLVGRFRDETGVDPAWFEKAITDPAIQPHLSLKIVEHIEDVAGEIDQCDILVQPASHDIADARYATPQKAFGYMVRGKPILAGDVPCHRELFQDGVDAELYELNPQALAYALVNLSESPDQAQRIAEGAWRKSEVYNYARRAGDIINNLQEQS